MKYVLNTISALSFLALVIFASCGGDDPVDEKSDGQLQAERMDGTWTIANVQFDTQERNDTWGTSFTITFDDATEGAEGVWGGDFTTSGHSTDEPDALEVWPATGTWDFLGTSLAETQTFVRNDGVEVDVAVTASTIVLTFTVDDPSGRSEAIYDLPWVFELNKVQ